MSNETSTEQWAVSIIINSDGDFSLDIGESLVVHGNTAVEARQNAATKLMDAEFYFVKAKNSNTAGDDVASGHVNYAHEWYILRAQAVAALRKGEQRFRFGGRHTIMFRVTPA